jgi:hypothetical protein
LKYIDVGDIEMMDFVFGDESEESSVTPRILLCMKKQQKLVLS